MARISSYNQDGTLNTADKVLGTDSATGLTKNYTIGSIMEAGNNANLIDSFDGAVYNFKDYIEPGSDIDGVINLNAGAAASTSFSSISLIYLSVNNSKGQDIGAFIDNTSNDFIKLTKKNDINIFGVFKVNSVIDWGDSNYKKLDVTHTKSNGSLILNQDYFLSNYGRNTQATTFTYTQDSVSSTWVIDHNLQKFPSVMVVDSSNNIVIGDITYNSNNRLTIEFSAPFAGKAFLN